MIWLLLLWVDVIAGDVKELCTLLMGGGVVLQLRRNSSSIRSLRFRANLSNKEDKI